MPGALGKHVEDESEAQYLRFGNEYGIEPLVIDREFHGLKENYLEISEEFRLFHNLYHDRAQDRYIKLDGSGNEDVVAIVKPRSVEIRLKEIRQFLAVKEMYLSIQFDCMVFSDKTIEEMGLAGGNVHTSDGLACWNLSYGDGGFYRDPAKRSFSILYGKRLIGPLPKAKSGFEGFAEESAKQHAEFIIGMDDDGDDLRYTCNPDLLSNYFGANPSAPHYVTPVNFRKRVLDRYYQEPSKYKVEDGMLSCGSLWDMRIDNHHDDKVCALLGDLGLLPHQEQLHWQSYNIASPSGYSEVAHHRNFLVEWVESDRPEHAFEERYRDLAEMCQENLGWQIFLPLESGDEYRIQGLRVPATDEQRDFDGLVLDLATILVDSLNVVRLKSLLPQSQETRGIYLMDALLKNCGADDAREHIAFLHNLQALRSSGSAHRKGGRYASVARRFGVGDQNLRTAFTDILWEAVAFMDYLIAVVENQRIPASP